MASLLLDVKMKLGGLPLVMIMLCSTVLTVCLLHVSAMEPHFYSSTCPSAESTVFSMLQQRYLADKSIAPSVILLLLHDCFVRGCDASILLRSSSQNQAERDAAPNLPLAKSFDLIDEIKERLEAQCPETVSCADIIAMAARDAVNLAGGQYFELLLGRHDGMESHAWEALSMLPDLHDSLPHALYAFQAKGFTAEEFFTLLGAHSIGTTQCKHVEGRLYNYNGTGSADPGMDKWLVERLRQECKKGGPEARVALDQATPFRLDSSYYRQVLQGKGVLAVDQELLNVMAVHHSEHDPHMMKMISTHHNITMNMTGPSLLLSKFAHHDSYFQTFFQHSIKKLTLLDVLTHSGETRTKCYQTNGHT